MLSCPWTTTQTWMWWQLLTGGGSTSTLAMPKERLVCLSILGEGSLLCGSSWVFFRLFSLLKGFFGGVFPFPFETLNGSLCFTNDVQCFLCFPSPSCLPLSVVADPGVEHKHSGAGGFLQSDHWHQQHNCHQINRICTQGQVRINRRSFCISTWTTPPPPLTLSSSPFGVLIPVLSFPLSLILPAFVLSCPVLSSKQLLPHKHSRPDHQGVWRQRDTDLWPRWWTWTHAETTGPGQQVCQHRTTAEDCWE